MAAALRNTSDDPTTVGFLRCAAGGGFDVPITFDLAVLSWPPFDLGLSRSSRRSPASVGTTLRVVRFRSVTPSYAC
jgi:hypothetical protein